MENQLENTTSEMRWDVISRSWVIIAPERGKRPGGFIQETQNASPVSKGEVCPFCAGQENFTPPPIQTIYKNSNDKQWFIRVVPNKYPVLRVEGKLERIAKGPFDMVSGIGAHEIVIESPSCEKQFSEFSAREVFYVLKAYHGRLNDLRGDERFRQIVIFKNHGRAAGATMYHSHSQIIALPERSQRLQSMLATAKAHYASKERCIFCDIIGFEKEARKRVIYEDEYFVAFVPYAARSPFQIKIFPRKHQHDFGFADDADLNGLSLVLHLVFQKLNLALDFPAYNLTVDTAPPARNEHGRSGYWDSLEKDFHWCFNIIPRVTHFAGFELSTGMNINPVAPEEAAKHLRSVKI